LRRWYAAASDKLVQQHQVTNVGFAVFVDVPIGCHSRARKPNCHGKEKQAENQTRNASRDDTPPARKVALY